LKNITQKLYVREKWQEVKLGDFFLHKSTMDGDILYVGMIGSLKEFLSYFQ